MDALTLGRFQPLELILSADDFNSGQAGWLDLRPNFVKPGFRAQSDEVDLVHWGPTMLSTATFPRAGTHGALSGQYSLKLSTRKSAARPDAPPAPGSMGLALKRMSQPSRLRKLKLEAWLAYTPEDDREGLGDTDVRSFGCMIDLQTQGNRWQPGVRYVNAINGQRVKRWQRFGVSPSADDSSWSFGQPGWHKVGIDSQWYGQRYADGSSDGFQWIEDGAQETIANESDDKINWTYFALTVDMAERRYESLHFLDKTFDLSQHAPFHAEPYDDLNGLINPVFFIESDTDRRAFLFIDSIVVSCTPES